MKRSGGALGIAIFSLACASGGQQRSTAGHESSQPEITGTFEVRQPFPDEARLQQLTSQPAADPSVGLGDAPATVDHWTVEGPAPAEAGAIAFTSTDPLRTRAAEAIARQASGARATAGMMCVAHEYARFVAAHDHPPPADIQLFMTGRCGAAVTQIHYRTIRAPKNAKPQRLLSDEAMLADAAEGMPDGGHIGLGWADGEKHRIFAVAGGRPDVEIEPVKLDLGDGSAVVIRGKVLWPFEWLHAHYTRGELGHGTCVPLPGGGGLDGEFALQCNVDAKDSLAFIEVAAAERGALMGRTVLALAVSPDGSGPLEYAAPVYALPVDPADRRPEGLVAALNAVRERARQQPLRLSSEQSTATQNLFEHLQGQTDVGVRNEIALGIMAGWQVEGTIRDGQFKVTPANHEWTLERLLAGSLASPSFRAVALDPRVDIVAVGQVESASSQARGVLWATYDLFEPRSFAEEEEMFFDELDAQRASVGLGPVVRARGPNDRKVLDASAERIRKHESTPPEELQVLLQHFAQTVQRGFHGVVLAPMRIEGWRPEFPKALFEFEHVAAAAKISYFKPEGAAWGQHVVLLVFTELDGPFVQPRE